ncbi:MAG: Crp/Fnr family transcriptional regulator [Fimbriimonadaceae bacterium]|nr:Crp/Fnr family transcriptional regulator [Fimbriimonadaceae bacterium]
MSEFPSAPTKLQVLRASNLLNSLTEDQISEVAGASHLAYVERGEIIWLTGNTVDFFGVVGLGFVKMTTTTAAGQDVTTELMGPGQVFGLLGAVDGSGCPQCARAVCNSWYLKVPKRIFMPIFQENVVLKEHLIRRTTNRLRNSHKLITRLSSAKVDQRLASILFMLADSYGVSDGNRLVIQVPLTRQDLSEMAGTTVETTIRVMSQWQKLGWVETQSKTIVILNEGALSALL